MIDEIKSWWESAKRDQETAEYLFEGKRYKESSFFCQQSIEKALKSIVIKKKKKLIKIHDLVKLAQLAGSMKSLKKSAKESAPCMLTRGTRTGKKKATQKKRQGKI